VNALSLILVKNKCTQGQHNGKIEQMFCCSYNHIISLIHPSMNYTWMYFIFALYINQTCCINKIVLRIWLGCPIQCLIQNILCILMNSSFNLNSVLNCLCTLISNLHVLKMFCRAHPVVSVCIVSMLSVSF